MKALIRYFGYFGWLVLLAYVQNRLPRLVSRQEHVQNRTVTRYNWVFALLAAAPLVYLAAIRGDFVDTASYRNTFISAPSTFAELPGYIDNVKKDKAFYVVTAVLRIILGERPVVYFGIIALFQILCFSKTIRKYSPYLLTSFFIFVASTDYLSYMQNGIRQFISVTIIFSCSDFIFEKKYIQAILVILFASLFHQSALLMIPIVFIVQGEPWNKTTVLFMLIALLILLFVDRFTNLLDDFLTDTQYSNVVNDWTAIMDNGTNPIRVLVYSTPMVLSLIGLPFIRETNDNVIKVCTNLSVIASGLFLVSMVTSGVFIGRLPIYACLYSNCILLPWEVNNFFSKESSQFIRGAMIVLFLLFYYYQIHSVWYLI